MSNQARPYDVAPEHPDVVVIPVRYHRHSHTIPDQFQALTRIGPAIYRDVATTHDAARDKVLRMVENDVLR